MQKFKIGLGYDIHKLVSGRKLIIGGVLIPFDKGLLGHSDADCLTHSIIDAILGVTIKKDIGRVFGVDKKENKGIRSLILLEKVYNKIKKCGCKVNNVDSVIVCEKPKLSGFISQMEINISKCLHIPLDSVSIKSTTSKGIGKIGKGKAIAVYSIVSIVR